MQRVRLRQGYGVTAFGLSPFRPVNPPLFADGLPGRKKSRQETCTQLPYA